MRKTTLIAEAGVNHNGSIGLAKRMADIAKQAGCDYIKFQTFKAVNLAGRSAEKAKYQKETTNSDESQLEMLKSLELSFNQFTELKQYCDNIGILFISTPFDLESIDFLADLGVPLFKIPSGEITNLPYLRKINSYKKEVILSTGMSTIDEIKDALAILKDCKVSLLHANTEYPTPPCDANLSAITTLKEEFNLPIGYSDHTLGIEAPIAAVALGAEVIEKHFTLDKNMSGPDHKASLEPDELKTMVNAIRKTELMLGNGIKKPSQSELKNMSIARKSIIAKIPIKKGEIFTENNLCVKRPGNGISPMKWDEIIGTAAQKDYEEDDLI